MSRLRVVAVVLASVAAATGVGAVRAGDPAPFRLEERVGADALAFASLDGFPAGWRAALAPTSIGSLFRDGGLDDAIRPAAELLRRAIGRAGVNMTMCAHFATALEGLDGQLAVAVTGLRHDGTPAVVVSLDFGARLSELRAFSARVLDPPPDGEASTTTFPSDAGGVHWRAVTRGTTIVLDNFPREADGTGARPSLDPVSDPLAKVPAFVEARGAEVPRVGCFAYANLATLVSRALDAPDGRWSKAFVRAAGLDALTTCSYRASVEASGVVEALRVGASKAEHGVFSLFRTAPIAGTTSPPEPRRTWCHLETSLPISSWPSRWRTFVHGVDADDERDVVDGIARLDHVMGASLEGEILAGLVDEQTLSIGLSDGGGAFPDVVLSIPLRDPAKFEPMFARAVSGLCADLTDRGDARFAVRELRVGPHAVHIVASAGAGADTPAFSPTWAVVGGRLVLTLVPYTMSALLRRVDRDAARGSPASPSPSAALVAARAEGTACVVASGDVLSSAYDTLVPLAQAVPTWKAALADVDLDALRLPLAEFATGSWSDAVVSLRVATDGVTLRATSPTGVVPVALAILAAFDAAHADEAADDGEASASHSTAFASGTADDPAEVTKGAIEQTVELLREYAALHGSFPASLDDVVVAARLAPRLPLDGWRRALDYAPPVGTNLPRVRSAGEDGVLGTGDDVVVDVGPAPK